jgi:hypothetical protein
MMDRWIEQLLRDVRSGQPADLAGTRVVGDVAISDRLVNEAIAGKIGPDAAVRDVTVRAEPGRARVTVRIARPSFLPPLSFVLTVESQPQLPASPVLVLRVGMMPGVAALLGTGLNFMNVLPPGLRLEGDRLFVDIAAVIKDRGYGWALPYLRSLSVAFEAGRIVNHVEVASS